MHNSLTTNREGAANKDALLTTILLLIDSLHYVFARMLLPHIAPSVSAAYVLAVGTVEVGLFGLIRKQLHFTALRRHLWVFLGIGFLVAASTNINYEAVAFVDPGIAALLSKTSVLFSLGLSLLWLREKLNRKQAGGTLVALLGVFIIAFQPGDYLRIGSIMILCSTLMYALHSAVYKRYGEGIPFLDFFFFRLLCTSAFLFAFAAGRGAVVWPDATAWLYLGLVGTVDVMISRSLYYAALRRLKMSSLSVILTLSPVVAVIWSFLLFGTAPSFQQILGGAAVILGVLIVTINQDREATW